MRLTLALLPLLALASHGAVPAAAGLSFRHHVIASSFPGVTSGSGYSTGGLADFDRDGKPEFAYGHTTNQYYRYEPQNADTWTAAAMGPASGTLGGNTGDVDRDGWTDLASGRYWYRNNRNGTFTRYEYDSGSVDVHDVAFADMNGDGAADLVVCSDRMGIFWYEIPAAPAQNAAWPRHLITDDALIAKERIHGGFFPRGLADLNRDGRVDVVAARFWYENLGGGLTWRRHVLPFSRVKGPYGWSARSWAADLDRNGTTDLVMTDADQANSRAAILFSNGANPPAFSVLELPKTAPGTRGSFHSLAVADFDRDGDLDVFTVEQDDPNLAPQGATPRWYVWENLDGSGRSWAERVIFDGRLGGHDALIGDVDGDGDVDIVSKVWAPSPNNANSGRFHADYLENLSTSPGGAVTPPAAPSGLAASAASSNRIDLSWTDNSADETGFQVERAGASSGPWTTIATVTGRTYADAGLAASTTYWYRVRALNGAGASAYSNSASAGTLAAVGGIPSSGLAFWVKADAGVTLNGSTVSQWADQSGNGRHATQGAVGSQPLRTSNALQFDGVNDFLSFNLPINGWTGMSIVLVSAATANPTGGSNGGEHAPLFWEETSSWGWTFLSPFQTSVKLRFGTTQSGNLPAYERPASVGSALTTTVSRHGGTTDALFVDGVQVWSAGGKLAALNGAVSTPWIGRGALNTYFSGRISEILVYNRAISDAERQSIELALNAKYGAPPPPPPPPPPSTNLAPNSGFESDPTVHYFTHGSGTFTWASDAAHGGTRSLKISSAQPSGAYARWLSKTTVIPAQAGSTYTAAAWLKASGVGGRGVITMNFWNASSAVLAGHDGGSVSGTGAWTPVSVSATAPPGTAYVRVEFRLWGPGTLWADDLSLSR